MTTKQMLLSAFILAIISNIALSTTTSSVPEKVKPYSPFTLHTYSPDKESTCTINKDHIIFNAKFKGSCPHSGPLMLEEINETLGRKFEPLMDQKEFELMDRMEKATSSDCRCNLLFVAMKKNGDPERLHELFNQAAKNTQKPHA